ncbi:MAG: hypothetical protein WCH43_03365 [Verrucomicrobiota bacterium]
MKAPRTEIKAVKTHPLEWLLEPLENQADYLRKKMFGCEAVYLNGRLMLVLADGEEPWNGLMIATSREHHPALLAEWKAFSSHAVLGKWLYVSQNHPEFEMTATAVVRSILKGDTRMGVEPKLRKRKVKKS